MIFKNKKQMASLDMKISYKPGYCCFLTWKWNNDA